MVSSNTFFPIITDDTKALPIYLVGYGCQENQEHIKREKGFSHFQLSLCEKGEGVFIAGGKAHHITPGTFFYFERQIPHEYYSTSEPWRVRWVLISGVLRAHIMNSRGFGEFGAFKAGKQDIESFISLTNSAGAGELAHSTMLYHLILSLSRGMGGGKRQNRRVALAVQYMENNIKSQISLSDLANVSGVSVFHLCRLFSSAFGTTPQKYLTKLRLKTAKELLVSRPRLSIKEVARESGFADPSYFCAVFKRENSISPGAFRKSLGLM